MNLKTNSYLWIILAGLLVLGTAVYLVRFALPILDVCPRTPDSYVFCIEPISWLPLILVVTIPLLVAGIWFIIHEFKKLAVIGNGQTKART